jgi:hypothetical protein
MQGEAVVELTPDQVARVVLVAVAPAQPQHLLLRPEQ